MEGITLALETAKALFGDDMRRRANAYAAGQRAKANGWMRVSPYYESHVLDAEFFRGYDGETA